MRVAFYFIPDRTREPILELQDYAYYNMEYKSQKKEYLEHLYNIVTSHKMRGSIKPFSTVVSQEAKVNTKMYQQKANQKQASDGHINLFCNRRNVHP
jgi:hypothetical protein